MLTRTIIFFAASLLALGSCAKVEDLPDTAPKPRQQMNFDITVTRDGEVIAAERYGNMTKGASAEEFDKYATMNPDKSFGLIGIDAATGALLMDNQEIYNKGGRYVGWADNTNWGDTRRITLSAYYPYKTDISYHSNNEAYNIPFTTEETQEGPLVSKTMQQAVDRALGLMAERRGAYVCTPNPEIILEARRDREVLDAVNGAAARNAVTHIKVLERFVKYTLVKAILETGRTHQIRVHMAYVHHPLVGDELYGPRRQSSKIEGIAVSGQLLHAGTLGFIHPSTGEYMEFHSDLPEVFEQVLAKLRK